MSRQNEHGMMRLMDGELELTYGNADRVTRYIQVWWTDEGEDWTIVWGEKIYTREEFMRKRYRGEIQWNSGGSR